MPRNTSYSVTPRMDATMTITLPAPLKSALLIYAGQRFSNISAVIRQLLHMLAESDPLFRELVDQSFADDPEKTNDIEKLVKEISGK